MKDRRQINLEREMYSKLLSAERCDCKSNTWRGHDLLSRPLFCESFSWLGYEPFDCDPPKFSGFFEDSIEIITKHKGDGEDVSRLIYRRLASDLTLMEFNPRKNWEPFSPIVERILNYSVDDLSKMMKSIQVQNFMVEGLRESYFEFLSMQAFWVRIWKYFLITNINYKQYSVNDEEEFNRILSQFAVDYPDIKV